ncbi:MAG: hypothetical protein AMXMBFR64_28710 [Myxococcales bacterium]
MKQEQRDHRNHVSELLGAWLDGELSEAEAAAVEAEVATCAACQEEVEGLVALREAFREPVIAAAQTASFDGVWERIEAGIAARPGASLSPVPVPEVLPDAVRRAAVEQPSLWERLRAAWSTVFGGQPVMAAAFAAAVVVAVAVALLLPDGSKDKAAGERGPAEISAASPAKSGRPQEPVGVAGGGDNRAWISAVEYTRGTVIIDQIQDDPSEPTIVWHYDDEPVDSGVQGG